MIYKLINLLRIVMNQRTNLILNNIKVAKLPKWKHEPGNVFTDWKVRFFLKDIAQMSLLKSAFIHLTGTQVELIQNNNYGNIF